MTDVLEILEQALRITKENLDYLEQLSPDERLLSPNMNALRMIVAITNTIEKQLSDPELDPRKLQGDEFDAKCAEAIELLALDAKKQQAKKAKV